MEDMEEVAMEKTDTTVVTLLVFLLAANAILWAVIQAEMLPTVFSRTDATGLRPWILQGIPICLTLGDHREDTMISYIVLGDPNPIRPSDIHQRQLLPQAVPASMPPLRTGFR